MLLDGEEDEGEEEDEKDDDNIESDAMIKVCFDSCGSIFSIAIVDKFKFT